MSDTWKRADRVRARREAEQYGPVLPKRPTTAARVLALLLLAWVLLALIALTVAVWQYAPALAGWTG